MEEAEEEAAEEMWRCGWRGAGGSSSASKVTGNVVKCVLWTLIGFLSVVVECDPASCV